MIRATGITRQGQKFLMLGVDRENIVRLTKGQPIVCKGETVNMEWDVVIVFGETLADVETQLAQLGVVKPPSNDRAP